MGDLSGISDYSYCYDFLRKHKCSQLRISCRVKLFSKDSNVHRSWIFLLLQKLLFHADLEIVYAFAWIGVKFKFINCWLIDSMLNSPKVPSTRLKMLKLMKQFLQLFIFLCMEVLTCPDDIILAFRYMLAYMCHQDSWYSENNHL
jgi:hypothetical protein